MGEGVAGVGVDGAQGSLAGPEMVRMGRPDAFPIALGGLADHPLRTDLSDDSGNVMA